MLQDRDASTNFGVSVGKARYNFCDLSPMHSGETAEGKRDQNL